MPEGKNAKGNGLPLAASVGGMILASSTTRTGEPGPGRWADVVLGPGVAVLQLKGQMLKALFLGSYGQMNS